VIWHRAKARYTRWVEEVKIVGSEMEWTVAWFESMQRIWERRFLEAKEGGQRGHGCYAKKQALIWAEMKEKGRNAFKTCLEDFGL
jgi:hypothetical protein